MALAADIDFDRTRLAGRNPDRRDPAQEVRTDREVLGGREVLVETAGERRSVDHATVREHEHTAQIRRRKLRREGGARSVRLGDLRDVRGLDAGAGGYGRI